MSMSKTKIENSTETVNLSAKKGSVKDKLKDTLLNDIPVIDDKKDTEKDKVSSFASAFKKYQSNLENELKSLSADVCSRLKGNSPLTYSVKVPVSLTSYLSNYEPSGFQGLANLILDSVADRLYDDLVSDFSSYVFNQGVEYNHLPNTLLKPLSIPANTRLSKAFDKIVFTYGDMGAFFYQDIAKYPFPDDLVNSKSAVFLSQSYDDNLAQIQYLEGSVDRLQEKIKVLSSALHTSNVQIEDLKGELSKSQVSFYEVQGVFKSFKLSHFSIPKPAYLFKKYVIPLFKKGGKNE